MKEYLGDGIYCNKWDGGLIVLTTESGCDPSNTIYMGDTEMLMLFRYLEKAFNLKIEVQRLPKGDL